MTEPGEITAILAEARGGDAQALEKLIPIVYGELRRLANYYMQQERTGHTLQATALVHEAYIRLLGAEKLDLLNRAHFFAVAAQVMRNLLVDHARARQRVKRGGGCMVSLDEAASLAAAGTEELLAIHDALEVLARIDPRQSRIVELRYFGGLSVQEIAAVLEISERTVKREWQMAKAWLCDQVRGTAGS
jgi:RNA polymerase sigma-70 factor (ECF subfamily)